MSWGWIAAELLQEDMCHQFATISTTPCCIYDALSFYICIYTMCSVPIDMWVYKFWLGIVYLSNPLPPTMELQCWRPPHQYILLKRTPVLPIMHGLPQQMSQKHCRPSFYKYVTLSKGCARHCGFREKHIQSPSLEISPGPLDGSSCYFFNYPSSM